MFYLAILLISVQMIKLYSNNTQIWLQTLLIEKNNIKRHRSLFDSFHASHSSTSHGLASFKCIITTMLVYNFVSKKIYFSANNENVCIFNVLVIKYCWVGWDSKICLHTSWNRCKSFNNGFHCNEITIHVYIKKPINVFACFERRFVKITFIETLSGAG